MAATYDRKPRVRRDRTLPGNVSSHTAYSPPTPCDRCLAGPRGIEGHERLFAQTLAPTTVCFECIDCRQVWTRSYSGEGHFDWNRTGLVVDQGVSLPKKT